jgi:hypothetical protein
VRARRIGARVAVDLDPAESHLLQAMIEDVEQALTQLPAQDPVRARLLPDGYRGDDHAAADFRSMTESALIDSKGRSLRSCVAELAAPDGSGADHVAVLDLDGAALQRWLQVLNDLRLALGTRIGVSDEDSGFDADDSPADQVGQSSDQIAWTIYRWLTAIQDDLVVLAMQE